MFKDLTPESKSIVGATSLVVVLASAITIGAVFFLTASANSVAEAAITQLGIDDKAAISTASAALQTKVDALQKAGVEWQNALKSAAEKPDATYKIKKGDDGVLSLVEIQPPAPPEAQPATPAATDPSSKK